MFSNIYDGKPTQGYARKMETLIVFGYLNKVQSDPYISLKKKDILQKGIPCEWERVQCARIEYSVLGQNIIEGKGKKEDEENLLKMTPSNRYI